MTEPTFDLVRSALLDYEHLAPEARRPWLEALKRHQPLLHDAVMSMMRFERHRASGIVELPMPEVGPRYALIGLLGRGGMGEVWEVFDTELRRPLALKVLSRALATLPAMRDRFRAECQTQAQLQHPHIVPIHEMDLLPDGRLYFTMRKIEGQTLSEVIAEPTEAWPLPRLVATFGQVCHAVAYAHGRGVLHRDLKPQNVMVGPFGEALVVDWGLAKVIGEALTAEDVGAAPVVTEGSQITMMGQITGTPAYMSPEQVRGEPADARSDVYALGAMLYCVLAGRAPYEGSTPRDVLASVKAGPPRWPPQRPGVPPAPDDLVATCARAMARGPKERFATAKELADQVQAWLDGRKDHERALDLVAVAEREQALAERLRSRASTLQAEANAWLHNTSPRASEEAKAPGWAKADEAARLRRDADLREVAYRQTLWAALNHAPDLEEAHARLARHHLEHHRRAEARRDHAEAAQRADLIRRHDRLGRLAGYLEGTGAVSVRTEPPGAEVVLTRYVERRRRLVEVDARCLGRTPLVEVPLPMGSYVLHLRMPGMHDVRYPVVIERQQHWDGIPPGRKVPRAVHLLADGTLGPEEVRVPGGWFWAGGDPTAYQSLPRQRVWVDGFVIQRHPVTWSAFAAFLNALEAEGRRDDALRYVPRPNAGGDPLVAHQDGRWAVTGEQLAWPVTQVDWHAAQAYATWWAERTGQPWALPAELAWEKAARGVDGRFYPWGDHLDPSWCNVRASGVGCPAPVGGFVVDVSPYGVAGTAGNVSDWCTDVPRGAPTFRAVRGGAFVTNQVLARVANRNRYVATRRDAYNGFRLMRHLPSSGGKVK